MVRPLLPRQPMIFQDYPKGVDFPSSQVESKPEPIDVRESKKKAKLRGVWINFIGRIVAQIFGAVASIVLGVIFLHKYQAAKPVAPPEVGVARVARVANHAAGGAAIAVLPLVNFSSDEHDTYLADGITEAVITGLAQVDGLRVISRTSTMPYKATQKTVPEIARELDVDLILEGSIVRSGGRVRVTAQLIDADSDEHIWARSYERTLDNVLAVQADVAAAIARDVSRAFVIPNS